MSFLTIVIVALSMGFQFYMAIYFIKAMRKGRNIIDKALKGLFALLLLAITLLLFWSLVTGHVASSQRKELTSFGFVH
jgi:uncharacterized membrane-anchored protein